MGKTNRSKAAKREAVKDLTAEGRKDVKGGTVLTNLANMRHEMLKAVAQNLRS